MPEESVVRRLAFIRYLHNLGVEQSRQLEPMSAAAVLMLHDSAELLLVLASEKLSVNRKDLTFMQHWSELGPRPAGAELPLKEPMRRLNQMRVNLKHGGHLPSRLDIDEARETATRFIREATLAVFGVDLDTVSMASMVANPGARASLEEAGRQASGQDYRGALSSAAVAFAELLDGRLNMSHIHVWSRTEARRLRHHPYSQGQVRDLQTRQLVQDLIRDMETTTNRVNELTQKLEVLALGIDYARYMQFKRLTPSVVRLRDGTRRFHGGIDSSVCTAEQAAFCVNFVVGVALRLQSLEPEPPDSASPKAAAAKPDEPS